METSLEEYKTQDNSKPLPNLVDSTSNSSARKLVDDTKQKTWGTWGDLSVGDQATLLEHHQKGHTKHVV